MDHGLSGYTNYLCRCEVCKQASHEYNLAYRLKHRDPMIAVRQAERAEKRAAQEAAKVDAKLKRETRAKAPRKSMALPPEELAARKATRDAIRLEREELSKEERARQHAVRLRHTAKLRALAQKEADAARSADNEIRWEQRMAAMAERKKRHDSLEALECQTENEALLALVADLERRLATSERKLADVLR